MNTIFGGDAGTDAEPASIRGVINRVVGVLEATRRRHRSSREHAASLARHAIALAVTQNPGILSTKTQPMISPCKTAVSQSSERRGPGTNDAPTHFISGSARGRFSGGIGMDGMNMGAEPVAPTMQRFGTSGISPLVRPGLIARSFMGILRAVERLNLRSARMGNPPVHDTAAFPWAGEIECEWQLIRTELDQVLLRQSELPSFQSISRDVGSINQDAGWKTFFLCGYGNVSQRNVEQCPQTWRLLQKIPGLRAAMFSVFEPGKHLPAHRGPYNGVLRFHLGLKVPEVSDRLAIRVGDQLCHWREGEALIFDDAYEHEAWNHTEQTRVVLFVDFDKPLRPPVSAINRAILGAAMFTPFVREGVDNHSAWEKRFYAQAEALRQT